LIDDNNTVDIEEEEKTEVKVSTTVKSRERPPRPMTVLLKP